MARKKDNSLVLEGEAAGKKVRLCLQDVDANKGLTRKCPKCRKVKPLDEFGLRQISANTTREQSWCRACR